MTMDDLLEVKALSVRYGQNAPAVDGIDFRISRGEIVAIVGESGSGKSTTAHAVTGLLGDGVDIRGNISFDGIELSRLPAKAMQALRGAAIGFVPQDPGVALNPSIRIGDQVAEVFHIHRVAQGKEAHRRAIEALEAAGLAQAAQRARLYPHQLSGGMRQRVLIAMALACRPKLVIADEPTSALDVTVQRRVLDTLQTLARDAQAAVVLITHDLAMAAHRADRVIVMQAGRVVETGSAKQVLTRPVHAYTQQLIAAMPGLRVARSSRGSALPTGSATRTASAFGSDVYAGLTLNSVLASNQGPLKRPGGLTQAAQPTTLLNVSRLSRTFRVRGDADIAAVRDVSFTLGKGQTYALVGESGSGKTTTARMITRLDDADSGTIVLDGDDITHLRGEALRQLRRRVQLVYQNPYASLDPRMTVADIVVEPLRAFSVGTPRDRRERAAELLEQVALNGDYLGRTPSQLSGGQRQRVAIARALALQPSLLVLDEAVSALDVSVQGQILDLLKRLQDDLNLTYLFISHDLGVVREISDYVGVMRAGVLLEQGDVETVFEQPVHAYTRELIAAAPDLALAWS